MGGFCCNGPPEPENQVKFDEMNKIRISNKEEIKQSYNDLSEFNKNIINNGDYITEDDFNTFIPEEIKNFIQKNPFEINQENMKSFSFEVEPFQFTNGNIYKGKWNKNLEFNGSGKYYLSQEKIFIEGFWENGQLKFGRLFFPNGDIYKGEIKDSKYHGKGKLISMDEVYEGDFVNGEKNGKGKLVFNDKTIYEGNFENGEFKGQGKMIWNNGYKYKGEFKGPVLSGKGVLSTPNGDIYEGDFENNSFHGKGKYKFNKTGNNYEGEFQFGIKKGKGIFNCLNKYIYEGNWDNDLPCGIGKVTNWEKTCVLKSIWRFGKIAEEPFYESGSEEDFKSINLNIIGDEKMDLDIKALTHLNYVENDSTQYKLKSVLSFLTEN